MRFAFYADPVLPGSHPVGQRVVADQRGAITVGMVHFGVGGFHRAHQAMYLDQPMNRGEALAIAWRPTPRRTGTIAAIWHAIDLVWLLILPVIYLG